MINIDKEIENLRKMYNSALEAKTRAEGRLEQIMETLKKEHGVKTIDEAEDKLVKVEKQVEKKKKELAALLEKLHEEFEWGD